MIYEYIEKNYQEGEPIFLSELPFKNKESLRQEMKRLTDEGKLIRVFNGVYIKKYQTILKTEGKMSIYMYIDKKYLIDNNGFYTGLTLVNRYGFSTQVPAVYEIMSNNASTNHRKLNIDGFRLIIYKPPVKITKKNLSAIRFLELMRNIDSYSELKGEELKNKLRTFVDRTNVDFNEVKKYIAYYPDKVYKNIYNGGLMNELV